MKEAKLTLWKLFGAQFLFDLYHEIFPHDNTVLLKLSLPTLTEFYNIISLAWLEERNRILQLNSDNDIPNFKAVFQNFVDFFEILLPSVRFFSLLHINM